MALLERSDSYGEMQRVVDYLFKNTPIVERLDVILAAETFDVCADMREIVELLYLRHCGVGRRPVARALNQQVRYANGVAEKGRSPLQACAAALSPARASPASDLRSSRATGSHDPASLCRAAALLHLCFALALIYQGFALLRIQ